MTNETPSQHHGSVKRMSKRRADGNCSADEDQHTCPCSRCSHLIHDQESLSDLTEFEPMKKKVKPNEENVMFDVGYVESCLLAIANKSNDWNVYHVSDCDEPPKTIDRTQAKPLRDKVVVDLLNLTEIQCKDTNPNGLNTFTSPNYVQSIPSPQEMTSFSNLEVGEQESSMNINKTSRRKQSVESFKRREHFENPQPQGMVRQSNILNIKSWMSATNYMETRQDMHSSLSSIKTCDDSSEPSKSATEINKPSSMKSINNSCCMQEISSGSDISLGRPRCQNLDVELEEIPSNKPSNLVSNCACNVCRCSQEKSSGSDILLGTFGSCQNSDDKKGTLPNKPSTSISANAGNSCRLQEISSKLDFSPVRCPTFTTEIIKGTSPKKSYTHTSINTVNSCRRLQEKHRSDILLGSMQQPTTNTNNKKRKRKKKSTTNHEKPVESTPSSPAVVMLVDYLLLLESCKTISNKPPRTGTKRGANQKLHSPAEKSGSVGYNFVNGNIPGSQMRTGLRPVIIDGSNVALGHTHGKAFSVRGLEICIDYFKDLGHDVIAFVPRYRSELKQTTDRKLLLQLEAEGLVIFTPSRWVEGSLQVSYDDRYTVQCATELGGVIVSTDNFRDLLKENPAWTKTINERLLQFTWVGSILIFPQDPQGRRGASLKELLRF